MKSYFAKVRNGSLEEEDDAGNAEFCGGVSEKKRRELEACGW